MDIKRIEKTQTLMVPVKFAEKTTVKDVTAYRWKRLTCCLKGNTIDVLYALRSLTKKTALE
jgi:hypothetical protein